MKKKFNTRVFKVSVDGGFTCPNRDGTKNFGGCIFCSESGNSSSRLQNLSLSITEQIQKNILVRKKRYRAKKFLVYFQSFSNTYAPIEILKKRYDEAILSDENIVGLVIATRPDCIDEEKIALIQSYQKRIPYVSIEYGMQTIHNETLNLLNQCSTHQDLLKAVKLAQNYQIPVTLHVMLNLPFEDKEKELETAKALAKLDIEGVKIHLLSALKNSIFTQKYYDTKLWQSYDFTTYIELICDFLEYLPPHFVIHRLSGGGHPKEVVEPLWLWDKKQSIIQEVVKTFEKRKTFQGFRL